MGALGAMGGAMGGAFGGGSAQEPVLDMRNDPELRAKIEQVIGRELTPGTSERLDFTSDPQMGARVMQVIAQHQAEKQMQALGGTAAAGAAMPMSTNSSADDSLAQLERLDALRQSGALSQEEFDAQKRKLLG
jgi:hypothetical protein